jgi:hypothetical protein
MREQPVHEHIHLVINRVRFDGTVTSDSHDYRRQEVLMRHLEKDLVLQPVKTSRESTRHASTRGEIEHSLRTGEASFRQAAAAVRCRGFRFCQLYRLRRPSGVRWLPMFGVLAALLTIGLWRWLGPSLIAVNANEKAIAAEIKEELRQELKNESRSRRK